MVQARTDIGGLDISPDGTQIIFGASQTGSSVTDYSTFVMPAPLGGVPRKLYDRGLGARFSPDGKRIVYVSPGGGGGDALVVCDSDGGNPKEIYRTHIHAHEPAWSSDGRFIYFQKSIATIRPEPSEIWRVAAEGGTPGTRRHHLASRGLPGPHAGRERPALCGQPGLGGDGPLVASPVPSQTGPHHDRGGRIRGAPDFGRRATSSPPRSSIRSVPSSSSRPRPPRRRRGSSSGAFGDADPSPSPAGDLLVWSSARSGNRNLWIGKADGSGARPLTTGNALDETPAFSPDGKQSRVRLGPLRDAGNLGRRRAREERPASCTAPKSWTRFPGRRMGGRSFSALRPGRAKASTGSPSPISA